MAEDLQLIVSGTKYEGWKTQRVTMSLDQLARTFDVGYTEKATQDSKPVPIFRGDPCSLKIDGKLVVSGYASSVDKNQGWGECGANIKGSSFTGNLVPCTAIHKGGQWLNATCLTIAEDICKPFGIKVRADVGVGAKLPRFALEEGETAYEAIKRAAGQRALLLLTDADGTLVLTRAGTYKSGTVLKYGVNIKQSSWTSSMDELFSSYTVKAQVAGSDIFSGSAANTIKATVPDSRITMYRPVTLCADSEDSKKELLDRAKWERNQRYGAATRYACTVKGWYDNDGVLWAPNILAQVDDPGFNLADTLLIVSVQFARSIEEGTTTQLELTSKEAYELIDIPAKKVKSKGGFRLTDG